MPAGNCCWGQRWMAQGLIYFWRQIWFQALRPAHIIVQFLCIHWVKWIARGAVARTWARVRGACIPGVKWVARGAVAGAHWSHVLLRLRSILGRNKVGVFNFLHIFQDDQNLTWFLLSAMISPMMISPSSLTVSLAASAASISSLETSS